MGATAEKRVFDDINLFENLPFPVSQKAGYSILTQLSGLGA
jgi:hypothetical protein